MKTDIEKITAIAALCRVADKLHLFYYTNRDALRSMPRILIGSEAIPLILNNTKRGVDHLQKRADPFLKYCHSIVVSHSGDTEVRKEVRQAGNLLRQFNELVGEVKGEQIQMSSFRNASVLLVEVMKI